MKLPRILLVVVLLSTLAACASIPELPGIPPGWTVTPSLSPTPAASPIPSATPTPVPVVRIANGDHALFSGDFDDALAHFQSAFQDSSDPELQAAAKWGEARTLYQDGRYAECVAALQALVDQFPDSSHVPEAYFLKGLALNELGNYLEAATAWGTYLERRPGVLDAYAQELRGDAFTAAKSYTDALASYSASMQAPRLDDGIYVDLKIAQVTADSGDYESALSRYAGIAARTGNDYLQAQVAYLSGQAYQALGRSDEAYASYRLAVEQYPLAYYSYLSLVELVDAQVQVSDLDRGIVDYYAGQYDKAMERLDLYLAATPVNDGTAHYYRALALRELGNYQGAIDEFSTFITNYSSHPKWSEAWDDKAYLQWAYLDQYEAAAATLTDFVAVFPASTSSPDFLMTAGRILERGSLLDQAAQTWQRVADDYPGNEQASTAVFQTGIIRYRQGNFAAALEAFNRSLSVATAADDQARAYLWLGKTQQQLGSIEEMQKAWQQGQSLDPGGYYSERARDLMTNPNPFAPPAAFNLSYDLASERSAADTWVRLTFSLPAETDLSGLGPLAQDPRIVRGTALWNLGLLDDARLEFEDLRNSLSASAVDSYRLGNYLLDLGLYRSAIFSLRQTLTLAGLDEHSESMMAPMYFSHARYGLYFSDLIIPDAQTEALNPLFVFSIVRQESFFEGFVHSTAGARGLMQIIPSTGASIAADLRWPFGYEDVDLYRPDVSIRLGTHYLASNLAMMGGDPFSALAAYNAGPGNAAAWKEIAGGDPDLYLEVVRFEETRLYIRNIYEIYSIYRRLYGTS
jgi:soluble lytic murein transglycosylase